MRIAGRERIAEYVRRHPESKSAFSRWVDLVAAVWWGNPSDVRATFRTVDFVAEKVVFNVGGNKHRIIADIVFAARVVAVREVLSHKDYEKGKWK